MVVAVAADGAAVDQVVDQAVLQRQAAVDTSLQASVAPAGDEDAMDILNETLDPLQSLHFFLPSYSLHQTEEGASLSKPLLLGTWFA